LAGLFPVGAGLGAAIGWGTASGDVAGLTGQLVSDALCGRATSLRDALFAGISGAISGGLFGAVGWGVRGLINRWMVMKNGLVYRGGSKTPQNLTPRPGIDRTGLSTFNDLGKAVKPGGKAQVIDVSHLDPSLQAVRDLFPPGHVSIRPVDPTLMVEWASTRGTGTIHPFTQMVIDAIVDTVTRPK
jgi:hypothetical protein